MVCVNLSDWAIFNHKKYTISWNALECISYLYF